MRSLVLAAAMLAASASHLPVLAQDWPAKPVTMIIGFSAGGSTDLGARMVGAELEKRIGVPVVAENRAGGSGQVGYNVLLGSEPDGYTLGTVSGSAILGPIDPDIAAPYTKDSFAPIARIVFDPNVLAVRADSPYPTLNDLLDAAEADPEGVTISQVAPTGGDALMRVLLEQGSNARLGVVTYPNGATTVTTALLAGDLDVMAANVGDVLEFVRAGQIRILGVAGEERSPFLPDVPTFREQGRDIVVGSSRGFAFPAGTPAEVVARVSSAIGEVAADPAFRARMEAGGLQISYLDATRYRAFWDAETERLKTYIGTLREQSQQ